MDDLRLSAWEEERLQVLDAVAADLRSGDAGRDRLAVCRYLLQHLCAGSIMSPYE